MARPRKTEEERQRTARACSTCQKRKQKCTGVKPCQTCLKRNTTCTYRQRESSQTDDSSPFRSPKRRLVEQAADSDYHHGLLTSPANDGPEDHFPEDFSLILPAMLQGQGEEPEVYGKNRMLQDADGRLLYVGDSATVSYLQLIRLVVESTAGASQFTMDPSRHKTTAVAWTMPETARAGRILPVPEKKVTDVLVQSFFTHTHGLIDIFDRRLFQQTLNSYYSSPLNVKASDICLIYLVLSIGLVMATPIVDSPEHHIITQLRSQGVDYAEAFFKSAKASSDPESGFEDGDFWTVQALCLMSVYTLAVSKRNAAYAYLGQAVRSAHALGLHRDREIAVMFEKDHLTERRNLWRSLFVLDRFLAMSLGRPPAISEDDCSEDSLEAPTRPSSKAKIRRDQNISSNALNANVEASRIIGKILKKVYSKHEISTKAAQDIADDCKRWSNDLHYTLDSNKLFKGAGALAQSMAILHTQLLGWHSIILLTRPFFTYLLIKVGKIRAATQTSALEQNSRMERFSEACVAASTRTIRLTQAVSVAQRLPQRDPFVVYFVFTAALIIMSNKFVCLHENPAYEESMSHAMNILSYCATTDVQAGRFVHILTSFEVVLQMQATSEGSAQRARPVYPAKISPGFSKDLTESLPSSHRQIANKGDNTSRSPLTALGESEADISHVSQAPMNPQGRPQPGIIPTHVAGVKSSPASSLTLLSQACGTLERQGSDSRGTGSLHSEQGFHFDGFWEGPVPHVHTPVTAPGPMAQIHAVGAGDVMEYSNYAVPGVTTTPQNQSTGIARSSAMIMYPLDDCAKYEI
ncbi:hypothetical protein AK830_g9257 [Neonectria ditissima]|uniref:Zn(2)-C6 fungal-type domain-containing protein n=1 Tax=Neonectria ditissima TaxID=78410 RepID=A0A0P7AV91_9HYPO|nr:hypothetical protein AK830_g9257 [Neonectria ditissima]